MATEQAIENCKKPGAVRILGDIICNFTVPLPLKNLSLRTNLRLMLAEEPKLKFLILMISLQNGS